MTVFNPEAKKPFSISYDVFQRLDPYHRAAAEILQEKGECVIVGHAVKAP